MFHGISRDVFDQIMIDFKEKYNVELKVQFRPKHMREMAFTYKAVLKENNVHFEEDLFEQLMQTIMYVFESWSSERAQVYRDHLQIADEWGTAVIVQQMIIGNLNLNSGTGVVFTQNPNRQRPGVHLYGDFTLTSQGEDIVGGLVNVHPVGKTQRKQQDLEKESLQEMLPEIYKRIHQIATELTENQGYNPQEIEFTFESDNPEELYILQTRDQDIAQPNIINIFSTKREEMQLAGRGTGIGGGAFNGIIAFDKKDIATLKEQQPRDQIILVRPDTVPDDIEMIFECDGLLTAKGGATSHAAVTAVRLGKTCVVNCSALQVDEDNKTCELNGTSFKNGDKIAIDGKNGNIFKGNYPIEETQDSIF
jgi:pyruvate,orthophosphate dikinase